MTGIELIATERMRQVKQEGWTPEHDDEHDDESLALAAICYAAPIPIFQREGDEHYFAFVDPWPDSWDTEWDKRPVDYMMEPRKPTPDERVRMLVKAGALIAAEIDRLQRDALKTANVEVTGAAQLYRAASVWTAGLGYLYLSNSSSARPMSLAIWRSKIGEMSRP